MIQLGVLLVIGGVAGALLRQRQKTHKASATLALPASQDTDTKTVSTTKPDASFDDVGELTHYQKIAWYTLALSAAGTWFYPPVRLICLPLLGYNTYHFFRTLQHVPTVDRKSPMVVFESIGVLGSLLTGSLVSGAGLLLFAFSSRKFLLNMGNMANNAGFSGPLNPQQKPVWVLREGTEVEVKVSELMDGDIVVLRAGEVIALEGKVLEGEGCVRQFGLNKKMHLLAKQVGDRVYPLTQLDSGVLKVKPV